MYELISTCSLHVPYKYYYISTHFIFVLHILLVAFHVRIEDLDSYTKFGEIVKYQL